MKKGSDFSFWHDFEALSQQHWMGRSFEGSGFFSFKGLFNFTGHWVGDIMGDKEDSHMLVQHDATIKGSIVCKSLTVEGVIESGQIVCDELRVKKGARVLASVRAGRMYIEEGALVHGHLHSVRKLAQRNVKSP